MKSKTKHTQKNYTLAFKLSVVEQVEKGELNMKLHRTYMVFKVAQRFSFGFASMVA